MYKISDLHNKLQKLQSVFVRITEAQNPQYKINFYKRLFYEPLYHKAMI